MKLTPSAEAYAWRQLARRAGLPEKGGFEQLGYSIYYGSPDEVDATTRALIVCRSNENAWDELLSLPPQRLRWIPSKETIPPGASLSFKNPIPILFWGANVDGATQSFAQKLPNGSLVFYADILAATLFMLSRWEETVIEARDSHSRFPASHSTAFNLGFLDFPVVDQYALILRAWLKAAVPGWEPRRNMSSINLTHDVDHVYQFASPLSFARALGIALTSKDKKASLASEFRSLWMQWINPQHGERYRAIRELAEYSNEQGFVSRFYFMSAKPSLKQQGYDPANLLVQRMFNQLREGGHEIGFHPGYSTFENPVLLTWEKERLEKALGAKVTDGRQHFLRFRVPYTWRHWEQAGLKNDSTLGYADHEGFRCGTCHPFAPFDLEADRELDLVETPLIVMDTTLIEYRKMTVEEARQRILELAYRCIEAEGVFTLLWHNVTLVGRYEAWGSMYRGILHQLKDALVQNRTG